MVSLGGATAHRGVRHVHSRRRWRSWRKRISSAHHSAVPAVINGARCSPRSPRDKRAGYVEAVKVALIRDAQFFEDLERDANALHEFDPTAMQRLIHRCAELHLDHIATSGDPFEFGSARPLDFGHWSAHKLEQLSEYGSATARRSQQRALI